jgi:hypothetical protein
MVSKEYCFPKFTEEMYLRLNEWYNDGCCASHYHGSIGGELVFEITPTSLGDVIEVTCSCRQKIRLQGLGG